MPSTAAERQPTVGAPSRPTKRGELAEAAIEARHAEVEQLGRLLPRSRVARTRRGVARCHAVVRTSSEVRDRGDASARTASSQRVDARRERSCGWRGSHTPANRSGRRPRSSAPASRVGRQHVVTPIATAPAASRSAPTRVRRRRAAAGSRASAARSASSSASARRGRAASPRRSASHRATRGTPVPAGGTASDAASAAAASAGASTPLERALAVERLPQRDAERELIGCARRRRAARAARAPCTPACPSRRRCASAGRRRVGIVDRAPTHRLRARGRSRRRARAPSSVDEHVLRLEVAMDEPGRVRGGEPAAGARRTRRRSRATPARGAVEPARAACRRATSSIAMKTRSSTAPTSCTATTFGCDSCAIACASRKQRVRASVGSPAPSRSSLSATLRSSSGS